MKRTNQMTRAGTPKAGTKRKTVMRGVGKPKREWRAGEPMIEARSIYNERASRSYTRRLNRRVGPTAPAAAGLIGIAKAIFGSVFAAGRQYLKQQAELRAQKMERRAARGR